MYIMMLSSILVFPVSELDKDHHIYGILYVFGEWSKKLTLGVGFMGGIELREL